MGYCIYNYKTHQRDYSAVLRGDGTVMEVEGSRMVRDITDNTLVMWDTGFKDHYTGDTIYNTDCAAKVVTKDSKEKFALVKNMNGDTFYIGHPYPIDDNYTADDMLVITNQMGEMPLLTKVLELED